MASVLPAASSNGLVLRGAFFSCANPQIEPTITIYQKNIFLTITTYF